MVASRVIFVFLLLVVCVYAKKQNRLCCCCHVFDSSVGPEPRKGMLDRFKLPATDESCQSDERKAVCGWYFPGFVVEAFSDDTSCNLGAAICKATVEPTMEPRLSEEDFIGEEEEDEEQELEQDDLHEEDEHRVSHVPTMIAEPEKKCCLFSDFDQTITTIHLYSETGGRNEPDELQETMVNRKGEETSFTNWAFGSEDRLKLLQAFFDGVHSKCKTYVESFGHKNMIAKSLKLVGMEGSFDGIEGGESNGMRDKFIRIQFYIDEEVCDKDYTFFIDDDVGQVKGVRRVVGADGRLGSNAYEISPRKGIQAHHIKEICEKMNAKLGDNTPDYCKQKAEDVF